jgi:DNA-binding PadR family transcriptional regulator
MAETGWVDMEHIEQDDRPDRKVYHITDSGQDELLQWLTTPPNQTAVRNLWLAQVFFAHPLPDDKIFALFKGHADMLRQKLELFRNGVQKVVERRFAEVGSKRSRRLWQFTLDYGIAHLEWELQWVENALKDLQNLPSD